MHYLPAQSAFQKAFTLLEVLVALAVFAIGISTVVKVSSTHAQQVSYLEEKTFAQWVALNKVNELKLGSWPDIGISRGDELLANHVWYWQASVSGTPDNDVRRIEVEVRSDTRQSSPLVKLVSFVGRPM